MRKVQALPVFLLVMLLSSVAFTPPEKVSAISVKEYFNPFINIKKYIQTTLDDTQPSFAGSHFNEEDSEIIYNTAPMHSEYVVKAKDTIQAIAQYYKISQAEILSGNPWLREPIEAGQIIYIPLSAKRIHHVAWGETIYTIASRYGVEVADIIMENQDLDVMQLEVNQEVVLPKERKSIVRVAAIPTVKVNPFIWPVQGIITSKFGPRWGLFHQGVDIWNSIERQAEIRTALSGSVVFAGWHGGGYGRLVVIDHGNDIHTYYAHLSQIRVQEGQKVRQGDLLGYMGDSGQTTGIHLHFEIRVNDQPLNPLLYLPEKQNEIVLQ
ncbi:hypothetical protein BHU72_04850 [Desulfuribacillus stibiiarsenatis]|uniref:LysM domain-containing protein n=1 Tax=Desulfuribacillus stibiiarsenatis TaxID=1390249 RepID=A0A1E5L5N1_9FIRM|nr:M23 family metallopeptidase [Desulfuribacillus stibiiarsenatis]OEH85421.1 hypothetical protein BHU72_04850 [Desulfuribacillus stibiiarsenatis]